MKHLNLYLLLIVFISCKSEGNQEQAIGDNADYQQAYEYLGERKTDSAFYHFNLAKNLFLESNDNLNIANCFIQMAIILTNQGDYFGGQETSLQALPYLDEGNPDHYYYLGSNFNNLGIAAHRLKDYQNSLKFYDSAIRFSTDSISARKYLNNKAKTHQQAKEYDAALDIYEQIVEESFQNQWEYARALTNLTITKWAQDPEYDARQELWSALHIRQREKDLWGQNSSYAHLADYYTSKQPDSALFYARKRYTTAKQLHSSEDVVQALQKLIQLGPADSAKYYFEDYRHLNDSIQLARRTTANQFAFIRYEVEQRKAENLRLQHENAQKAHQVARQRVWTGMAILLALMVSVGGTYWHRKRKQRLELETQNQIKAHQLKTSKKIHDVVANGLYRVMTEIENKTDIDREGILDRLEDMYEKSRGISYETEELPQLHPDYHEQIAELLKSFATESRKIIIAGNDPELWEHADVQTRHEINYVLQELMVNMRKHSQATNVVVRFDSADHQLYIYYSDNGIGLPESFTRGNGLANTGNRIESLRGQITFASEGGSGLKVEVVLPVSKNTIADV